MLYNFGLIILVIINNLNHIRPTNIVVAAAATKLFHSKGDWIDYSTLEKKRSMERLCGNTCLQG